MPGIVSRAVGLFGPKVLGKAAFEAEQTVVKAKSHIFGPKVLIPSDPKPAAEATDTRPNEPEDGLDDNDDGYLSEAEVADALEKQPELFDRLVDMEFARSASGQKPRKGVLRRLLKHEKAQAAPRPEVVHLLETAL